MDFESYVSNYEGYTRIQRLFFIAKHFPEAKQECMEICVKLLQGTDNYRDLLNALISLGKSNSEAAASIDSILKKNNMKEERLEQELKHYKNNMIKESIRVSCLFISYNNILVYCYHLC